MHGSAPCCKRGFPECAPPRTDNTEKHATGPRRGSTIQNIPGPGEGCRQKPVLQDRKNMKSDLKKH